MQESKVSLAAANEICMDAVLVAPFIRTGWHFYKTVQQVVVVLDTASTGSKKNKKKI